MATMTAGICNDEVHERNSSFWGVLVETARSGRAFWVACVVFLLDGAAYFGLLNILTLMCQERFGMEKATAGYFVSGLTGSLTLFAFLTGHLVDRWGPKRAIAVALVAGIVGRGLLAVAATWAFPGRELAAWFALVPLAWSIGILQSAVYAKARTVLSERTRAFGMGLVYGLMNAGVVLVSACSPAMRAKWGMPGVAWACASLVVLALVVHHLLHPSEDAVRNRVEVRPTNAAQTGRHPLADPKFMFFIFILLGVRTLFAHQWLTIPDYVRTVYAAEVHDRLEWIEGLNPFICLVGAPLVGLFTRQVRIVTVMIVGTAISAGSTFLLAPGPSVGALLLYQVLFSIGEAIWSGRFLEHAATIAPRDRIGVYMGLAGIPWMIAKFTTGFYSGHMLQIFCPPGGPDRSGTLWTIYGSIGCVSTVGLLLARKWLTSNQKETA